MRVNWQGDCTQEEWDAAMQKGAVAEAEISVVDSEIEFGNPVGAPLDDGELRNRRD